MASQADEAGGHQADGREIALADDQQVLATLCMEADRGRVFDRDGVAEPERGRTGLDTGRDRAALTIQGVLTGHISAADAIQARRSTYGQPAVATADERVRVRVAQDESDDATVVEVYAPDEIGLLATIASVFTGQALDVRVARVATTGEQAVDVFYVHEAGEKVTDPARVERLRTALFDSLRRD